MYACYLYIYIYIIDATAAGKIMSCYNNTIPTHYIDRRRKKNDNLPHSVPKATIHKQYMTVLMCVFKMKTENDYLLEQQYIDVTRVQRYNIYRKLLLYAYVLYFIVRSIRFCSFRTERCVIPKKIRRLSVKSVRSSHKGTNTQRMIYEPIIPENREMLKT